MFHPIQMALLNLTYKKNICTPAVCAYTRVYPTWTFVFLPRVELLELLHTFCIEILIDAVSLIHQPYLHTILLDINQFSLRHTGEVSKPLLWFQEAT